MHIRHEDCKCNAKHAEIMKIFNGEHADGKGQYYSPKGLNISDMQLPPKVVWDLVLEIASYESFPRRRKKSISLGVGQQHLEKNSPGKVGRLNVDEPAEPHERADDASDGERLSDEREEAERAQAASCKADKDIRDRVSRRGHAETEAEQFREIFEFKTVVPRQPPPLVGV